QLAEERSVERRVLPRLIRIPGPVPGDGLLRRSARSRPCWPSREPPGQSRPGGSVRLPQGMLARSEGAGPDDDEVVSLLRLGEDVVIRPAVVGKCQRPSVAGFHAQLLGDLLQVLFVSLGAFV